MQKEEKKDLTQNQIYDIIAQLNTTLKEEFYV
jgi:hypothetical protein